MQPLLSQEQINHCIEQGLYWDGHDLPNSYNNAHQGGSGDLSSLQQGRGLDYSETRPYQVGDEPRHINWRATARSGQPMVRVFHQEVTPRVYFLMDRRASMRFGTRVRLKVTQAARLAIFLASWEHHKGAELGALVLNESSQWHDKLNAQQGLMQFTRLVVAPSPPLAMDDKLSLKQAVSQLIQRIPSGSQVYLFSDFYDLDDQMQESLYMLGQQYTVVAIGIYDIAEKQLPRAGLLNLCC